MTLVVYHLHGRGKLVRKRFLQMVSKTSRVGDSVRDWWYHLSRGTPIYKKSSGTGLTIGARPETGRKTQMQRTSSLRELWAVYHLNGKTCWQNIAVNRTHQSPEWKFPRDAHVLFPRTFPQVPGKAKRPGNSSKEQVERTFSVWEFWTTFQEIPFSPEIFRL